MRQRRSGPGSPDHIRTSFPDQCLRRDQPQSRCLQSVHLTVQTNSMAAEKCCCESGRHYGWVSSRHSATKRSPVALRSRIGRCRSKFLPLLCDFKESHTLTAKAERGRQRRELAGPQRGFSRENSSWIEPRNFDFGRDCLSVRSPRDEPTTESAATESGGHPCRASGCQSRHGPAASIKLSTVRGAKRCRSVVQSDCWSK